MPRGGARTKSGPPPDPNSLRNHANTGEWITLPAEGRKGRTPKWPLLTLDEEPILASREAVLWKRLWSKPQAIMWEAQGVEYELALYVRRAVEAELPGASAGLGTLVLRMADNFGITPQGMNANKWKLGAVAVEDDDEGADDNVVDARDLFAASG